MTRVLLRAAGLCIALFKDIPDTKGDLAENVFTLAVRIGRRNVLRICTVLLLGAYVYGTAVCVRRGAPLAAAAHVAVACRLAVKLARVDLSEIKGSDKSIWSAYMFLWKCFYVEYLILPLVTAGL